MLCLLTVFGYYVYFFWLLSKEIFNSIYLFISNDYCIIHILCDISWLPIYQVLTTEWVEFQLSICCLVSQFQVLVFFAIAEYGLLLHTKSHRSKTYEISPQQPNDKHGCIKIGKKKFSMPLLDKIAIVVLPLLFIMFNVIYWSVYTTWIPYVRHHKPLLIWSHSRI